MGIDFWMFAPKSIPIPCGIDNLIVAPLFLINREYQISLGIS